jgi:phosphoglycerol transferase MdoB-like AlkP superfamily enzyme
METVFVFTHVIMLTCLLFILFLTINRKGQRQISWANTIKQFIRYLRIMYQYQEYHKE